MLSVTVHQTRNEPYHAESEHTKANASAILFGMNAVRGDVCDVFTKSTWQRMVYVLQGKTAMQCVVF